MIKIITVKNVSKSYKKKDEYILHDINLNINDGQIVGIIGENGAGKTSLIKIITGLIIPTIGEVWYDNILLNKKSLRKIYRITTIVLDGGRTLQWRLSVRDNFIYYATLKNIPKKIIEKNIDKYVNYFEIENLVNKKVKDLSLGQKQIVSIISTLVSESKYIFLDEPTNGLDLEMKLKFQALLNDIAREKKHTVIITTHDLEFLLTIADSCSVIDNGHIIKNIDLKKEQYESSYEYYKKSFFIKENNNV